MNRKYVLNQNRIDNIQSVDLDNLTFDDVYLHYRTGMAFSVIKNHEKIPKYRNGVATNIGDIEESVWRQIIKYLITKNGEEEIYEHIKQHNKEYGYHRNENELEMDALICHAYRLFDDPLWYHFVPFNRKFRPEILTSFKLLTVTCGCCGKPGEVTQEQIDNAIDGKISCPVCGIYSTYSVHDK